MKTSRASSLRFVGSAFVDKMQRRQDILAPEHFFSWVVHGIPVGEDITEVLEAGSALGFCNRLFEESGLSNGSVWHSLVSVSGEEIYSPNEKSH